MKNLYIILAIGILVQGCATVPWSQSPLKSQGEVEFTEVIKGEDYSKTHVLVRGNGDGKMLGNFTYRGPGENPWELEASNDAEITSPALSTMAEGYSQFVAKAGDRLPDLTNALSVVPTTSAGNGTSLRDLILGLVVEHPESLDSVIGWLSSLIGK